MIKLIRKNVNPDACPVIQEVQFSQATLLEQWDVRGGEWYVENEWLTGKNGGNFPGIITSKNDYPGNIMLDFEARTVLPSTHDIDFMWHCSWDERNNKRGSAYVVGIEGWWEGKAGIEKGPDYSLVVGTPLFDFTPGRTYHIQGGSIDGHCFLCIDGKLILEMTDPHPIDSTQHGKIGFEAFSSHIQIRNLAIKRVVWSPDETSYAPEF